MKFLCDEMLAGLARWLRAAGYDTALATRGTNDRLLLETAVAEARLLLSRDRRLLEFRKGPGRVILLRSQGMNAWAAELRDRLSLDWQLRPFTRCLLCNAPLEPADESMRGAVPVSAQATGGSVTWCPVCEKLYWSGSHVRRMRARLAAFNGPLPAP
jgi:uncharacterized protein with PIN domain